uniref:Uncharacterized protein n=1 Tax=viral metagenome TaxID=1070528 RepID=A0A6C0C8W7_9ZZZZ
MQISSKLRFFAATSRSTFNDLLNMPCKSPANMILCCNIAFNIQQSIEYDMRISSKSQSFVITFHSTIH